jgi:spoIIIJ-associated protein
MSEQTIREEIMNVIDRAGFEVSDISSSVDEHSGTYWFSIQSDDSRYLIGRDGDTLKALNYIIHRSLENKAREQDVSVPSFVIDINNYQKGKIKKLKTVAHMMAERARFFKSSVDVEPMNAFERKVVHEYIQSQDDLETESVGQGRDRHIVIKYKG